MKRHGVGFVFFGWILIILGLAFIIPPLVTAPDLLSQVNGKFDLPDLYFIQNKDAAIRLDVTLGVVMVIGGINTIGIGKVLKIVSRKAEKAPLE